MLIRTPKFNAETNKFLLDNAPEKAELGELHKRAYAMQPHEKDALIKRIDDFNARLVAAGGQAGAGFNKNFG